MNRWYMLRHPRGFDAALLATFAASCHLWQAKLQALVAGWEQLDPYRSFPRPTYEFGALESSPEHRLVMLPVGGECSHGVRHLFEDEFPRELYVHFPGWFQLELELGRKDLSAGDGEIAWRPLYSPERVRTLRELPGYRAPEEQK